MRLGSSRSLVWLLALVFASGVPLMWLFDEAGDAGAFEVALRGVHAVSTAALVAGVVLHLGGRLWRAARGGQEAPARSVRSGGWALASAGVAVLTGALADQTGHGAAALARFGMPGQVVAAAVLHVAYALVVVVAVYLHLARKPASRVFGSWRDAALAAGVVLVGVLLLPGVAPGSVAGHPATVAVAPGGVAWSLLLGVVVAVAAPWLVRRARPPTR